MKPPQTPGIPTSTVRSGGAGRGQVVGLPEPGRKRRPLLVIVGLVVAALAAVLVAVVLAAAGETTLVWSVAAPVSRGQPVVAIDLAPVEVPASAATGQVAATVESRAELTGGLVWAADLPAGQVVSSALTVRQLPLDAGRALVGVRLEPGGFPTVGLGSGDVVQVVAASDGAAETAGGEVVVGRATVEAVVVLADQGAASPLLVTLDVPGDRAAQVAAAGMAGRVALVVVP